MLHGLPSSLLAVCFSLISLSFIGNGLLQADDESRPPNIVLIMADDIGVEGLGCYGGTSYATPSLDRLATDGLRFTHAYAQPLCANTRLQLMTGLHNDRNWICFGILDPKSKTIGHYLNEAGYKSCIAGKWQLQSYDPPDYPGAEQRRGIGMHPKDAGFDNYSLYHSLHTEDKGSRYADPTWLEDGELRTAKGHYGPDIWVDYINQFMEREQEKPFFVYYPMALPHWPMVPTPDSPEWREPSQRLDADTRHFKAMVEYMDKSVGRVVKKIDDLGLRENTLIIFYSDNGTHLEITSQTENGPVAGGKALPTDAGTHVPMIASWPGRIKPGVTDALVDSTDFIPTLMDAVRQPLPADHQLDGISFYPHLVGEGADAPSREWIYSYYDPRPGWDKDRFTLHVSARDRRWKLYRTGNMFDIENDVLEQHPIRAESDTAETAAVRKRLATVLESQSNQLAREQSSPDSFEGKWALRMHNGDAGWLSIENRHDQWQGELWSVGRTRKITDMMLADDGTVTFTRQCRIGKPEFIGGPPTGKRVPCKHIATVSGDSIRVEMQFEKPDGTAGAIEHTGKRMPPLPPRPDLSKVRFGEPIQLFNGTDLNGWKLANPQQLNGWKAVNGELVNTTPKLTFDPFSKYGNLQTERVFGDSKLNIEFKVPPGGNSGIYVRGAYEAQVVDRDSRMQGIQGVGAIFGRIEPAKNAGKPGGQWQSYEITIVDRHATVVLNGEKVIDNQPIAGCTNGAYQADETIPGPLYLQGDHTAVSYRNIVIRPVIQEK